MTTYKQLQAKITRRQNAIDKIVDQIDETEAKKTDILQRIKDGELSEYNGRCMHSGLWHTVRELKQKLVAKRQEVRDLQKELHAMQKSENQVRVHSDALARQLLGLPPAKPADSVSMPKLLAFFEKLASEEKE